MAAPNRARARSSGLAEAGGGLRLACAGRLALGRRRAPRWRTSMSLPDSLQVGTSVRSSLKAIDLLQTSALGDQEEDPDCPQSDRLREGSGLGLAQSLHRRVWHERRTLSAPTAAASGAGSRADGRPTLRYGDSDFGSASTNWAGSRRHTGKRLANGPATRFVLLCLPPSCSMPMKKLDSSSTLHHRPQCRQFHLDTMGQRRGQHRWSPDLTRSAPKCCSRTIRHQHPNRAAAAAWVRKRPDATGSGEGKARRWHHRRCQQMME